jgi:hypothetical protein
MTTLQTYTGWLTQAARAVARKLGISLATSSKETRVVARIMIGMNAAIVKTLVDKGIVTDAEVQTLLSAYAGDTYVAEPVIPDADAAVVPEVTPPSPDEPAP